MVKPPEKRTIKLMLIHSMAWLFYALDGSVTAVLITNKSFIQIVNTTGLALIVGLRIGYENSPNKVANGFIVAFIALMTGNYWLLTTGPTVVYVNEILPSQAREIGVGMANAIPIAMGTALGQKWPLASEKLGPRSYIILLVTSSVSVALNWYFLVEPKGLSIEHVDVLFGERDHVEQVREELRLEKMKPQNANSGDPEDKHATVVHRENYPRTQKMPAKA